MEMCELPHLAAELKKMGKWQDLGEGGGDGGAQWGELDLIPGY